MRQDQQNRHERPVMWIETEATNLLLPLMVRPSVDPGHPKILRGEDPIATLANVAMTTPLSCWSLRGKRMISCPVCHRSEKDQELLACENVAWRRTN